MSTNQSSTHLETIAIHGGTHTADPHFGAVSPPIFQSSTFSFPSPEEGANRFAGKADGYIYTRIGNPTTTALEETLAQLEGGIGAVATASGMAAVSTVYLTFLNQGDHMIGSEAMYGPARVIMEQHFSRFGVEASFIDTGDFEALQAAWKPNTKLLYLETPANPTMRLTDLEQAATFAHKHNAKVVVDNTFCSPVLQHPFDFGVDVVLHSLTKFLNGHSDVVGGALIAKEKDTYSSLRKVMTTFGGNMDPNQAWLVLRGIRTLSLRVHAAQENAKQVASFLAEHPKISWIKYPGLSNFEQPEIAKKQMKGPGSLMAFEVTGGFEAGKTLLRNVKLCTLAVSLGGLESLIQHPASMTHSAMTPEGRQEAGITEGLVRLSVGCEHVDDIIADLRDALDHV